ncbi:MAG: exodeoxyribonuclease III, partial [Deltaproteobacteria bacterium]
MQIITWNVNSIRARKDRVLAWLAVQQPEVVCLQETKVTDDAFPRADFEALGYQVSVSGQPTYNGVAILSRTAPLDIRRGFDDGEEEREARVLAATVAEVRVLCVYVPNGQVVGSDKFAYKLAWLNRLRRYLEQHCDPAGLLALCGDLNVAPESRDVHDPAAWQDTVLFHPEARAALRDLCA